MSLSTRIRKTARAGNWCKRPRFPDPCLGAVIRVGALWQGKATPLTFIFPDKNAVVRWSPCCMWIVTRALTHGRSTLVGRPWWPQTLPADAIILRAEFASLTAALSLRLHSFPPPRFLLRLARFGCSL